MSAVVSCQIVRLSYAEQRTADHWSTQAELFAADLSRGDTTVAIAAGRPCAQGNAIAQCCPEDRQSGTVLVPGLCWLSEGATLPPLGLKATRVAFDGHQ